METASDHELCVTVGMQALSSPSQERALTNEGVCIYVLEIYV